MMGLSSEEILSKADEAASVGDFAEAWFQIRKLSLDEYGELLLDVPPTVPSLQSWLPTMPADEVQISWTGAAGHALLMQSCDFIRSLERGYRQYTGKTLTDASVLDYGCGWGRLIRLLSKYVDPRRIYGVDAWDHSIQLCRQHRCMGNLALCEYVPSTLPFDVEFDLIYAFSVFTHLSENTATAVLAQMRRYIVEDGLLVITVRPEEYWDVHSEWTAGYSAELLKHAHRNRGFAFMPHYRGPINGDITYGDTSMTLDFIRERWPEWKIVGTERSRPGLYQTLVFLKPA